MARKGSSKVKTGCRTCKIRKVKCDEGKPRCQRCISTGRKCDGYVTPASSTSLSWHRPRQLFPNIDDAQERRALEFFIKAAPSLSGPTDPYFWTHLVVQFSTFEPAVRHSVVAISSLYEQIQNDPDSVHPLVDNRLALGHYNSAIRRLKSMENEPLVLLVCVLFVCIEFLLRNREAAISHCNHAVRILENVEACYPWTKEYLAPIIRRLTMFPFFFTLDGSDFPPLLGLEDQIPPSFSSVDEAQYHISGITARTIRLVRWGDVYRLGDMRHKPVSEDLLAEQDTVRSLLSEWNTRFSDLRTRLPTTVIPDEMLCSILLRYEIACIWVETAFEYSEMVYDKYLDKFRLMVTRAAELQASKVPKPDTIQKGPKFIFEMGFLPLLYYIVIKCRCLETRIQALSLMKSLGVAKENLWETSTMHAAGRKIIELEHDLVLSEKGEISTSPVWPGLPPDEMRIRDSSTNYELTTEVNEKGQEIRGRLAGFFRRTAEGDIYLQTEFVPQTAS
ncbi:hypothetical protein F5Y04DRAFT_290737 [Hypomontagnella monticulosa]|nr:hypothetical protein F5Y04DRAFT_290737 [Hypomontagnella monticulosa]